jgi:hypothetical protein
MHSLPTRSAGLERPGFGSRRRVVNVSGPRSFRYVRGSYLGFTLGHFVLIALFSSKCSLLAYVERRPGGAEKLYGLTDLPSGSGGLAQDYADFRRLVTTTGHSEDQR